MSTTITRFAIITCVLLVILQAISGCGGGGSVTPATGRLLFLSSRDSNRYEIYIMNDNGTGVTRITNNTGQEQSASFSPDGSKIVYSYTPDPLLIQPDIYVMNADGSGINRLTNDSTIRHAFPVFSPDGETIAFERGSTMIGLMSADGGPVLSGFGGQQPHFSPDGSKIVFSRSNVDTRDIDIFTVDYPLSQSVPTATPLTTSADDDDLYPKFSPDGTKIAFERRDTNGSREIYIMNADGTGLTKLTDSAGHSYGPLSFSPDGSKITFVSDRDGNEDIYVMNADGTNQRRLTYNVKYDTAPSYDSTAF